MIRWLGCATLAALLAVGLSAMADNGKDAKDAKDKGKDSKAAKEFARLELEYNTDLTAAGNEVEKRKPVWEKYSPRFLDHAKKHLTDESAVLALSLVLQINAAQSKSKDRQEALEILKKEHAKSKQILPALRTLANLGTGFSSDATALEILKAVAKDNPDKLTRATAMDELASGLEFHSLVAARLLRDEKRLAETEKRLGEDFVRKFLDSADGARKESEGLRATLEKDYRDVLPSDEPKADPKGSVAVGTKAPDVVSEEISGKSVKLSGLAGKVVVLDFWATWCGPCKAMIPHTRELVKANEKKPFVFVSISCDAEKQTLEDFTRKTDMPWTHWWDGQGGKVARAYEVRAFPTIYVVDHKGVIRFKSVGFDKELDSVVEKCVKEAEGEKKD